MANETDNKSENSDNTLIEILQIPEEVFDELAEEDRYAYASKLEPFEVYKTRKEAQLRREWDESVKHLQNGYNVIIQTISSKEQTK
jgi:hypothetical protein